MWWLVVILLVLWIFTKPYYWYLKGIPCRLLPVPIFGNALPIFFSGPLSCFQIWYDSFDSRFAGFYLFNRPVLMVKDPDLIREAFVKSNDHFSSHGVRLNTDLDVMARSVFHVDGSEWKNTRKSLSMHFTPSKILNMLTSTEKSLEKLIKAVKKQRVLDVKPYMTNYTVDLTMSVLFGVEQDSQQAENIFTNNSSYVVMLSFISTQLLKLLKIISLSMSANTFFLDLLNSAMERDAECIVQGMKAQMWKRGYDSNFILAQSAIMFVGGVETTAFTLSFCLYELALSTDIQERAREEAFRGSNSEYVDAVISETLRKYPVFGILSRSCTKSYHIPDSDVVIENGTLIIIPAYSIQHDPMNFKDPEVFDPERFLSSSHSKSFMPFGLGPRTCLGKSFAQKSMRNTLTRLLKEFRFFKSDRTEIPLKLDTRSFFTAPLNGIWLRVEPLDLKA